MTHNDIAVTGAPEAIAALAEIAVAGGTRRLVLLSGRGEPEAPRALGRTPRDFTDFARDAAATGVWSR